MTFLHRPIEVRHGANRNARDDQIRRRVLRRHRWEVLQEVLFPVQKHQPQHVLLLARDRHVKFLRLVFRRFIHTPPQIGWWRGVAVGHLQVLDPFSRSLPAEPSLDLLGGLLRLADGDVVAEHLLELFFLLLPVLLVLLHADLLARHLAAVQVLHAGGRSLLLRPHLRLFRVHVFPGHLSSRRRLQFCCHRVFRDVLLHYRKVNVGQHRARQVLGMRNGGTHRFSLDHDALVSLLQVVRAAREQQRDAVRVPHLNEMVLRVVQTSPPGLVRPVHDLAGEHLHQVRKAFAAAVECQRVQRRLVGGVSQVCPRSLV
mmetsp:Transcript_8887/g.21659  ORF Transcript_8887/g.21659 Transcript_8887/m.21659 type:complete len:314 (-) Transcript_8887:720-1661(-)